jgi:hypothetical protein
MVQEQQHLARIEKLLGDIFGELGDFESRSQVGRDKTQADIVLTSESTGQVILIEAKSRERITPQIADSLFERFRQEPLPDGAIRLIYAPVISPRVAEVAKQHGISYLDQAGNCWIVNPSAGLLISRTGLKNEIPDEPETLADPFSPKSSRIVRAMLHEPLRGWRVSELAEHPDVAVSVGLVSKVKRSLVRENYAMVKDRLVYLHKPLDLLNAWVRNYSGPTGQRQFYLRGETPEAETRISHWFERAKITYALARFSAAWRLAPEVRYSVASMYVGAEALKPSALESLRADCGAKEVESGANLVLLTPFDEGVFVRRMQTPEQTTSPLQTYLDLKTMAGRGEEAAGAVFAKYLHQTFESGDKAEGGR